MRLQSRAPFSCPAPTTLGNGAFQGNDFTTITIAKTLTMLGVGVFGSGLTPLIFAGEGSGSYTVPLIFNLAIPANAAAGSYTGTLTATISSAP